MARKHEASPTLQVRITDEQYESAVQSHSGACLIADAIKRDYPHLVSISVDMATVRVTDRAAGERYTYLTPAIAQQVLLFFDQGWRTPIDHLTIRRAVKIDRVRAASKQQKLARGARRSSLVAKRERGEPMTRAEKAALTQYERTPEEQQDRPVNFGPIEVVDAPERGSAVIRGGQPIPSGGTHPNLLRGRNRHFGAKLADPGVAFQEAVEEAIRRRDEEQQQQDPVS